MIPCGIFVVTTEGDCEGRSVRTIGVFDGCIRDIALHLADQAYYRLYFSDYKEPTIYKGPYKPKALSIPVEYNGRPIPCSTTDKRAVELSKLEKTPLNKMTPDEKKMVAEALMKGEL